MHTLHDYVAKQLADKVKSRRVVVWYDERGEFQRFVDEVRGGPRTMSEPVPVGLAGTKVSLAEYAGSMFELRAVVEPHVSGDTPNSVVVYVPGFVRDRRSSVLMELEKAGMTWEPQLKQLAKNVLLQKYTLGVVDDMLPFDRKVSYEDLARAAAGNAGAEPPSILKSIFHDASGNDGPLTAWLMTDARDSEIVSKEATRELLKLINARLGLELADDAGLAKLRAITLRYILVGEFRGDLEGQPPTSLESVPLPPTKADADSIRATAALLRARYADSYASIANQMEKDLHLADTEIQAERLGSIDTFAFEERALLKHCGDLIASQTFAQALRVIAERESSFWLDRDVARKMQWEACRRMAELGVVCLEVQSTATKMSDDSNAWVKAYTSGDGWFRMDQAQRRLEEVVTKLTEPEERPLGVVRGIYEKTCHSLACGFTEALTRSAWTVPSILHQTRVFSEVVASRPRPTAYFLVDAMRFEMGAELVERFPRTAEVSIRPAIAALPSITPFGMAALHPGASASFSVAERAGKLGALIDDSHLPDLTARRKFAASRIPNLVDLTLDDVLTWQPARLSKKLENAEVIIVRSQEIDHAGENSSSRQARRIMDAVLGDVVNAVGRLARLGVEHSVISADHGHLFFATDRDESMRTDSPGGNQLDLHRRCWIGRGGSTPAGTVRVTASALGYASDLDFVFPKGCGVFRAGGDLAFHHGGPSLQELIVPVITVYSKVRESVRPSSKIEATGLPSAITNRIFSASFAFTDRQVSLAGSALTLRPVLVMGAKRVGEAGLAVEAHAEFDREQRTIKLSSGRSVTVGFMLTDDSEQVTSLRVVLQDPATDAELFRSAEIPVRLGVRT